MDILAQIIGLVAVAIYLISYQQKQRKNIIFLNVVSRGLYILQYVLLGAFSGAILDVLGAVSSVVAGKKNAPFIKKYFKVIAVIMTAVITAVGLIIAVANKSFLDLFSLAGVLLQIGALWASSERTIRRVSLMGTPFWLVYNLLSRAYGSAIGDALTICSIVIAMLRYKNISEE